MIKLINQWHFVMMSEDGNPIFLAKEELPPRPQDAQPDNGDPFTPWYEKESHAHYDEDGTFEGVHFFGCVAGALVFFSELRQSVPKKPCWTRRNFV